MAAIFLIIELKPKREKRGEKVLQRPDFSMVAKDRHCEREVGEFLRML